MMAQLAVSCFLSTYSRIAHMERNNLDFKLLVLPTSPQGSFIFALDDCNYRRKG